MTSTIVASPAVDILQMAKANKPKSPKESRVWNSHQVPKTKLELLKRVRDEKAFAWIDGFLVDTFSASAVLSICEALSADNQRKVLDRPMDATVALSFSLISKIRAKTS